MDTVEIVIFVQLIAQPRQKTPWTKMVLENDGNKNSLLNLMYYRTFGSAIIQYISISIMIIEQK